MLISDIQTAGDYFRRSDEAGTPNITAVKKLEAAALAIEDIHNQALFRFTQRVQRFDFLDGQSNRWTRWVKRNKANASNDSISLMDNLTT